MRFLVCLLAVAALGSASVPAAANTVRFMTYNCSLNRAVSGGLITSLSGNDLQARKVAEIVQRVQPDVLLLNEFDYDAAGVAAGLFQDRFLSVGQMGADPIAFPYRYIAESNTGIHSGFDLNNDGIINMTPGPATYSNDCFGFGAFPGQYGMVVYSKYPIETSEIRTFQKFLWKDMPGALLPDDASTPTPDDYYSPEELDVFRLSSKSHWDLPINVHGETIHLLASHPTPPTFDGPEDRNGRRNHDEIRLWRDYVTPGAGDYLYDDQGTAGGLAPGAKFVLMGDQNADPFDGDSLPGAANQLTESPMFNTHVTPSSAGGVEDSQLEGGINNQHLGNPAHDTADFGAPGNLRVDYVLPSAALGIAEAQVFWPTVNDPLRRLVDASDHLPVWVDVVVPEPSTGWLAIAGALLAAAWRAPRPWRGLAALLACLAVGPAQAEDAKVRFATFNASLNRREQGELIAHLSDGDDKQARAVAEIIQRVDPDVLLINEFDYDADGRAAELFQKNYLAVGQHVSQHPEGPARPIHFAYRYFAPVNTGVPSYYDLDHNQTSDEAGDSWGFGYFPGQYGMLLLSKLPLRTEEARTFQNFLWKDMPGARLPDDPATEAPADWYRAEILEKFPLSSKSHWDVPVEVNGRVIHVLASHPTPPSFDGDEDRNGLRNHDEIRLWADYLSPDKAGYLVDDAGRRGGLPPEASCVVMGDQNADPVDGQTVDLAIHQLLKHPRLQDPQPRSVGGAEQAALQGGANARHRGPAELDTGDFSEPPGNLRIDYVLPSKDLKVLDSGVFWPAEADPLFALVGRFPYPSSDHRLVWVDLAMPEARP